MSDFLGGVNLGSAYAGIGLDASALTDGIKQAKKSLADGVKDFGAQISGLGTDLVKLSAPVTGFFAVALRAAADSNKEFQQLKAVLASTQGVAGVTEQAAIDLAAGFEKTTNFSKEATLSAENMLLTFTNLKSNVFPDATKIVLDMSQALGQDLKASAIEVGKALNDPIKGVTALRRVGVQFTEAQEKQIKTLVETGHTLDAQKLILKELNTEFGGSAEAAVKADGGFTQLQNTVHDLMVAVGDDLAPAFSNIVGQIKPIIAQITEWITQNPQLVVDIGLAAAAFTGLGIALVVVGNVITAIGAIMALVNLPLLAVGAAVVALGLAFATNFGGIRDMLQPIIDGISTTLQSLWGHIQDGIHALQNGASLGDVLSGWWTQFTTWIGNFAATFIPKFQQAFSDLLGAIGDWLAGPGPGQLFDGLGSMFVQAATWIGTTGWPMFKTGIENLWTDLVNFVKTDGVQRFLAGLGALIGDAANWIIDKAIPWILSSFVTMIADIVKFLSGDGSKKMTDGLGSAIKDAINWIITTGIPLAVDAFDRLVRAVAGVVSRITDHIREAVVQGFTQIPGLGSSISVSADSPLMGLVNFKNSLDNLFHPKAVGGPLDPGFNLVGEHGAELLYNSGSSGHVFTNAQTQSILNGAKGSGDQIGTHNSGPSYNFSGMQVTVQANSFSEGQAAAQGWWSRMEELKNRQG
jgi:hypothetical protein